MAVKNYPIHATRITIARSLNHSMAQFLHPRVTRIVCPSAVAAFFSPEHPGVVQFVARRSYHGVVTLGQQHRVAVFDHENCGESVGIIGRPGGFKVSPASKRSAGTLSARAE
jgi:hypothetical protein